MRCDDTNCRIRGGTQHSIFSTLEDVEFTPGESGGYASTSRVSSLYLKLAFDVLWPGRYPVCMREKPGGCHPKVELDDSTMGDAEFESRSRVRCAAILQDAGFRFRSRAGYSVTLQDVELGFGGELNVPRCLRISNFKFRSRVIYSTILQGIKIS